MTLESSDARSGETLNPRVKRWTRRLKASWLLSEKPEFRQDDIDARASTLAASAPHALCRLYSPLCCFLPCLVHHAMAPKMRCAMKLFVLAEPKNCQRCKGARINQRDRYVV
jgi:hypothetical protein